MPEGLSKKAAMKLGICFNCMDKKHQSNKCPNKPACSTPDCKGRHHTPLHEGILQKFSKANKTQQRKSKEATSPKEDPKLGQPATSGASNRPEGDPEL